MNLFFILVFCWSNCRRRSLRYLLVVKSWTCPNFKKFFSSCFLRLACSLSEVGFLSLISPFLFLWASRTTSLAPTLSSQTCLLSGMILETLACFSSCRLPYFSSYHLVVYEKTSFLKLTLLMGFRLSSLCVKPIFFQLCWRLWWSFRLEAMICSRFACMMSWRLSSCDLCLVLRRRWSVPR